MSETHSGAHARQMDQVYRHQRHIYDLTRKYYLFGRDRVIANLGLAPGERLVEIGCGTARNLIAIAKLYPNTEICGLDASSEMLKTAQGRVNEAGMQSRIRLKQAYAENLNPQTFGGGAAPFDRALFSYSLSMIPDWRAALAAAAAVLKPEGSIHIVDFGDLGRLGPFAGALRAWLKLFHVSPRAEILAVVEPVAQDMGELWVSPGRYAFSFRCRPGELVGLCLRHVAAESQT